MPTLLGIYTLRNNTSLLSAAIGACIKAADAIRNEAGNTANHAARILWSDRVPDQNATQMMPVIAMNPLVQSTWEARMQQPEAERYDDDAIEYICNSNIDRFALLI